MHEAGGRVKRTLRGEIQGLSDAIEQPLLAEPFNPKGYFVLQPRQAANSNIAAISAGQGSALKRSPKRIAILDLFIEGRFIEAGLTSANHHASNTETREAFLDRAAGSDLLIIHAIYRDMIQRVLMDPILSRIPVVVVDSFERTDTETTRQCYLDKGVAAVLFLPMSVKDLLNLVDEVAL
jgi:hypothetical protein